jgi:hypothetical protein
MSVGGNATPKYFYPNQKRVKHLSIQDLGVLGILRLICRLNIQLHNIKLHHSVVNMEPAGCFAILEGSGAITSLNGYYILHRLTKIVLLNAVPDLIPSSAFALSF